MTISQIPTRSNSISVTEEKLLIHDLTVSHSESAAYVRSQLADHGPEAAEDLVRRSVAVGLVALSLGTAGIDTGSLTRTLDSFAERVDEKSKATLVSLDQTLTRLQAGEATTARTASSILENRLFVPAVGRA